MTAGTVEVAFVKWGLHEHMITAVMSRAGLKYVGALT